MRAGHLIQIIAVALLGLGVVMVHSAVMEVGSDRYGLEAFLYSQHTIFAAIGVVGMLLAVQLPWASWIERRGWLSVAPAGYLLGLILVGLTFFPYFGRTINGATRWIELAAGGLRISFQPSELMKYGLVLMLAWWCVRCGPRLRHWLTGFLPALLFVGLATGLVLVEDFGTAVLMIFVSGVILLAAGAKVLHLALLVPPALVTLALAIVHKPHRIERIRTFMNPFEDMQASGYQASQGLLALAQGGMWGRGLGNGIQKHDYLPTDMSDMILAVIGEELGVFAVSGVIVAFILLLIAGLQIVARLQSPAARLMVLGIITTVGVQALINIAVVLVVVPTKGMALPLISAGGTGWIVMAAVLGVAAACDREPAAAALPDAAERGAMGTDLRSRGRERMAAVG